MTLEEYYKKKSQIKVPDTLEWYERIDFINKSIEELQSKLSPEDLKEVLAAERRWADKMQSSVG